MTTRLRATYAEIRLSYLSQNFELLRGLQKDHDFICPMIKANAYGHGDVQVARTLGDHGANHLGVVLVEEGIRLREAGVKQNILVFGVFNREAAMEVVKYNLTPVISRWEDFRAIEEQLSLGAMYNVHVKFNTGMNRLGFDCEEAPNIAGHFKSSDRLHLAGVCTHLLNAEDSGELNGYSNRQIEKFEGIAKNFESPTVILHALNSSALCSQTYSGLGSRPGIALYGARPALKNEVELNLFPVMTVKSRLELLQRVKKGDVVSYGGTWRASRDSLIGIVPIGYADGYPRGASNRSKMLIHEILVPVIGIVCMDYTMIDLTEVANARVGDEVIVFGRQKSKQYTSDDLALAAGTIPYEILTRVSDRVPRVYLHEGVGT